MKWLYLALAVAAVLSIAGFLVKLWLKHRLDEIDGFGKARNRGPEDNIVVSFGADDGEDEEDGAGGEAEK